MKFSLLFSLLFLNFFFIVKAENIQEYEIENMSVGDSLLEYYSKNQIINNHQKSQYPGSDKYIIVNFFLDNYETYSWVQVDYKKGDDKFLIASISGTIEMNSNECYENQKQIAIEFSNTFPNAFKQEGTEKKRYDKTGKSINKSIQFFLQSGDVIQIACDDWSDEMTRRENFPDVLMISLSSKDYFDFMIKEAFN